MKKTMIAFVASLAVAGFAAAASAQERGYDNGPVWQISSVETKPGHFDDYMKFVTRTWRAEQEALKAAGYVVGYKVFTTVDARDNEPNIVLAVEWKNMAALDRPLDQRDDMTKKFFGSMEGASKASVDRESIRTQHGTTLFRELVLK
jgi:hypothetical protein